MKLSKWQALGNDYLLVEQAELPQPLTPDRVRQLCDYHYGVGSDGLLEITAVDGTRAEVRIWNPDG
jgi:diaminopimelate epimerase